ncbi:MAG TPA: hypothetical protein VHG51_21640 [Longimicrobiaceae bacterium]|nr:hypothetical protein [Longimicrobiaceae bacterium]
MIDDDRIDLSALEPRDVAGRWDAAVQRTLERVEAALLDRARGDDPFALIARWRRAVLAAVAAVVVVLVPVEWALERREAGAERVEGLVRLTAEAVHGRQSPTGAELLGAVSPRRLL